MIAWHISDSHTYHGFLKVPDNIDMVIFSGDCSNPRNPYTNEQEVRNFITWFNSLSIKHKIFVAGNHDTSIEKGLITKDNFEQCGIHYLENNTIEIEGLKIFGSPLSPTFGNGWAFNKDRNKLERIWRNIIDDDVDIVVTHTPPKGILDLAKKMDGTLDFCGCNSLMNRIREINPKLHCFGHIHNNGNIINRGRRELDDLDTLFSNGSIVTDRRFGVLNYNGNGNIIEI
jgi:Icc-related predicted phosphoesterase